MKYRGGRFEEGLEDFFLMRIAGWRKSRRFHPPGPGAPRRTFRASFSRRLEVQRTTKSTIRPLRSLRPCRTGILAILQARHFQVHAVTCRTSWPYADLPDAGAFF